jgi:hypothetical protein
VTDNDRDAMRDALQATESGRKVSGERRGRGEEDRTYSRRRTALASGSSKVVEMSLCESGTSE